MLLPQNIRQMKLKLLFIALLLCMGIVGCEEEDNKVILPNSKIIKVLPQKILSEASGIYSKKQEIFIINSMKELKSIFQKNPLPKDLTNIDFNENTIIVGSYGTTRGVHKLEHEFNKLEDKYEYILTIFQDLTFVAEGVNFGIIVEKIPSNSEVILKVNLKF